MHLWGIYLSTSVHMINLSNDQLVDGFSMDSRWSLHGFSTNSRWISMVGAIGQPSLPGRSKSLPGTPKTPSGSIRTFSWAQGLLGTSVRPPKTNQNHENRRKWTHMVRYGLRICVFEARRHFLSIANSPRPQIPSGNSKNDEKSKIPKLEESVDCRRISPINSSTAVPVLLEHRFGTPHPLMCHSKSMVEACQIRSSGLPDAWLPHA